MTNTKIQLLEGLINKANAAIKITEDLDIGYKNLEGVAVMSSAGEGNIFKTFSIAGSELFPKNFEVDFLKSNAYVSPNQRFFKVQEIADGRKVEIDFQDGGNNSVYPYTIKIYMLLSNGRL